jgi:acetolactate synthase I/III small subunit
MRYVISVLTENNFGVLSRVSGLFSARGFNIDSLSVGETDDPQISKMIIVVKGDENILEQIIKQLNKLVDIIKVNKFPAEGAVERNLVLIKIAVDKSVRGEIIKIADVFKANIVDISENSVIVEVTGSENKVKAFIKLLNTYNIKELARTGVVAMVRG